MKGLQVTFEHNNGYSDPKTISGKVISEPYPNIYRGFGAPPRNGGTHSTTNSTTWVVLQEDVTGQCHYDIPVTALRIQHPDVLLIQWLQNSGIYLGDLILSLEQYYKELEEQVSDWNTHIDSLHSTFTACLPNKLPVTVDTLSYYYDHLPSFKKVQKGFQGLEVVLIPTQTPLPQQDTLIRIFKECDNSFDEEAITMNYLPKYKISYHLRDWLTSFQKQCKEISREDILDAKIPHADTLLLAKIKGLTQEVNA